MRKFLAVAAVAVLAVAVAVPAMALDFKFGGEYRVRFYTYGNAGFVDGPLLSPSICADAPPTVTAGLFCANTSNPRGAQVRVRPRFDTSDDNGNITATLRLEIGDIEFGNGGGATSGPALGYPFGGNPNLLGTARVGNGSGGQIGADGINVETKWAYIDAAFPFGVPLRVRAGIQPWFLPKGIIVDDDAAGVRFYGTSSIVSYDASWYRLNGGPQINPGGSLVQTSTLFDNNFDFYNGKVDLALAKWLNIGVYGGYGRNAGTSVNPATGAVVPGATLPGGGNPKTWLYYGLTTTGDLGFMKYDFDFVGGRVNGLLSVAGSCPAGLSANCVDASGLGIDGGVHIPIGPLMINLVGSYFSGDSVDGGISEAMPFISPSWSGAGNTWEMFGAGGVFDPIDLSQDFPAGTWTAGISVEYRPVKALWLKAGYLYQNFTQNDANCANTLVQNVNGFNKYCFGAVYARLATDGTLTSTGLLNNNAETSLGNEFLFRADWDIWTGFKLQGQLGFWIPSSGDTTIEAAM